MSVPILAVDAPNAPARAAEALAAGGLVVLPTDTVYGVAADLWNARAVAALYDAKRRPPDRAIPILLADAAHASDIASSQPDEARVLAAAFWPGPLTLVVPRRADLPEIVSSLPTIGLRVPDHDGARAIIRAAGGALAVTSANLSDQPPAHTVEQAVAALGDSLALALDGGRTPGGQPSTVADVHREGGRGDFRVLRAGPLSERDLRAAIAQPRP